LDPKAFTEDGSYEKIRLERGYNYEDRLEVSPATLPGYDEKIRNFFTEHIHTDEEIRYQSTVIRSIPTHILV